MLFCSIFVVSFRRSLFIGLVYLTVNKFWVFFIEFTVILEQIPVIV